jgi:hypothetical protein
VFSGSDLGELPDWAVQWMELPEPIKSVRLGDNFMFHWAKKPPGGLRADAATYQWLATVVRDAVLNPYAIHRQRPNRYRIIQAANPPNLQYLSVRHVVFPIKYVPRSKARSPELLLITWFPLSSESAQRYLRNAKIRGT